MVSEEALLLQSVLHALMLLPLLLRPQGQQAVTAHEKERESAGLEFEAPQVLRPEDRP